MAIEIILAIGFITSLFLNFIFGFVMMGKDSFIEKKAREKAYEKIIEKYIEKKGKNGIYGFQYWLENEYLENKNSF